jgi:hypothetical protein
MAGALPKTTAEKITRAIAKASRILPPNVFLGSRFREQFKMSRIKKNVLEKFRGATRPVLPATQQAGVASCRDFDFAAMSEK